MKLDLIRGDIKKNYFLLLASAIGSTIVSTIYSTVDMICVGHYCGPEGSAAISCINPLWSLMISFGVLCGVGGAVMMANRKGAYDVRASNEYYTLGTAISLAFSIILMLLFIFFSEPLLGLFGAEGKVLEYSVEYMRSISIITPTFTLCATLSAFMRNDGEAIIPTVATVIGGVINIFLDIFFVFDFGLGLGIFGAGLATSIGQVVAFLIILGYFFTKKCNLKFAFPRNILTKTLRIFTVGFAAFVLELSWGVMTMVFNNIITSRLTENHLAVFGTASTVVVMFYCLYNGVGTAMQPLCASNYGANNGDRVAKTLKISLITAVAMGVVFALLTQLFPDVILKIYMDVTEPVMEIGPEIVRMYSLALPVVGVTIVSTYYFQSILKQPLSVTISLLRGLVFPILLVIVLPNIFGDGAIWLAFPIAEFLTFLIAIVFLLFSKSKNERELITETLSKTENIE